MTARRIRQLLAPLGRRLLHDTRGDLTTHLLITAAGCAMVGLCVPSLFNSSQRASNTFEKQVAVLENGASPGGGSTGGVGGIGGIASQVGGFANMVGGVANQVSGAVNAVQGTVSAVRSGNVAGVANGVAGIANGVGGLANQAGGSTTQQATVTTPVTAPLNNGRALTPEQARAIQVAVAQSRLH